MFACTNLGLFTVGFNSTIMSKEKEQKLVDIIFSVALTVNENHHYWKDKSREELAAWVSRQLSLCGFETEPIGSSWGVLKK